MINNSRNASMRGMSLIQLAVALAILGGLGIGILSYVDDLHASRDSMLAKSDSHATMQILADQINQYLTTRAAGKALRVGRNGLEFLRGTAQNDRDLLRYRLQSRCEAIPAKLQKYVPKGGNPWGAIAGNPCKLSCAAGQRPYLQLVAQSQDGTPRKNQRWPNSGDGSVRGMAASLFCTEQSPGSLVLHFGGLYLENGQWRIAVQSRVAQTQNLDNNIEWLP